MAKEDYYPRLKEIQLPCTIICGNQDATTPPWHAEAPDREIKDARNIWVEGKGHMLNWKAPEVLIKAVQSI